LVKDYIMAKLQYEDKISWFYVAPHNGLLYNDMGAQLWGSLINRLRR
jgi:hypothetical protein